MAEVVVSWNCSIQVVSFLFFSFLIYFYFFKKDPAIELKEKCGNESQCKELGNKLEECNKRVNSHPGTEENCEEELFDFLRCVDDCVSPI